MRNELEFRHKRWGCCSLDSQDFDCELAAMASQILLETQAVISYQLVQGLAAYKCSARSTALDESILFEPSKSRTDRKATHAVLPTELRFGRQPSIGEVTRFDRTTKGNFKLIVKRSWLVRLEALKFDWDSLSAQKYNHRHQQVYDRIVFPYGTDKH